MEGPMLKKSKENALILFFIFLFFFCSTMFDYSTKSKKLVGQKTFNLHSIVLSISTATYLPGAIKVISILYIIEPNNK